MGSQIRHARWFIGFAGAAWASALLCAGLTVTANAADIKICTIRAGMTVLTAIGPDFERSTGHKVDVLYDPVGAGCPNRVASGEPFDIVIGGPVIQGRLAKDGKIIADTRTDVAFNSMGVEVRAGAPKPDIGSVDALKLALINAKSIGYLAANRVQDLIDKLGLTDAVKSKIVVPSSDIVSELVAKGELDLAIVFITQILTTPGVEFVGPLPAEVQYKFPLTAVVVTTSKDPDAARELIKFLKAPVAVEAFKKQGMEPN